MSKSNYLENAVLDFWLKANSGTYSSPSTVYLGIFSSDPTDAGSGTEIASTGYTATGAGSNQRPPIAFGSASSGSIAGPTSDIEYENTSGSSFTVSHFGVFDAATSGNLLYHDSLSSSKTIANGDSIRFESSSAITITEG